MNLMETIMDYLGKKYPTPKGLLERNESWGKFPGKVDELWLCGVWADKQSGKRSKYKLPYFLNGEYQRYSVGQIVHLMTIGKWRGFYKITNIDRPYGDYADFDDGKKYDFILADIKREYKKKSTSHKRPKTT